MLVLGFTPLIAMGDRPDLAGIVVMFGIALPFLLIYLRNPEARWWAIIPGGITATVGMVVAIVLLFGEGNPVFLERISNVVMYLGIALTFVLIWLRHHKRWAMWVAIVTAILTVISAIVGDMERSWPVLLVIGGGLLLYRAFRDKTS